MPRADSKRFEVLQVLASVLQWDDEEKERAGLQRSQGAAGASGMKGHSRNRATSNMSNISTPATAPSTLADQALLSEPETSTNHRRPAGGESMDFAANESFSNLWIEYLLRESGSAAAAAAAAASGSSSSNGANKATSPRPSSAASNSTFGGLSSPPAGLANLSLSPPMRPSVSRQTSPSIVSSAAGSSVGGSNAQEGRRDTPASSVVSDGK